MSVSVYMIVNWSQSTKLTTKFIDKNTEYLKLNDTVIFHANNSTIITRKAYDYK